MGTASQDFKRVFKKWCNLSCPIKGKTGTVSIKDPNYRGTTVFTAVTDTKKLSRFLNLKSNFKKNKMISIGVVVFPERKTNNKKASDLHMHLIKDILFNKKAIYKG